MRVLQVCLASHYHPEQLHSLYSRLGLQACLLSLMKVWFSPSPVTGLCNDDNIDANTNDVIVNVQLLNKTYKSVWQTKLLG